MKKVLALVLALVMVLCLASCGAEKDAEKSAEGSDLKVGMIVLHDENIGYDAAHLEGIKSAFAALGLDEETQLIIKYSIGEDEGCYDAAVDLAEKGCDIIFADSFGHETYMLEAAAEYPEIMFAHATGTAAQTCELDNFCNYFTNIYEARYVSGVVAGMKLAELLESGEATDAHVGYVGAFPYAEVKSGYTAFLLGIQSIVPEAYMDVTFTNSWADQSAESAAAEALMARGCVIIGQHADTTGAPAAVQAAHEAGTVAYCVGYNVDMTAVAPDVALTSPQNNWAALYTAILEAAINGDEFQKDYSVGYAVKGVNISQLGDACVEGTAEKVEEVEKAIADGELHVFDTATWTVNGETLTSYDTSFGFEGTELISDGYFHESEYRSAPAFDIDIDTITLLSD